MNWGLVIFIGGYFLVGVSRVIYNFFHRGKWEESQQSVEAGSRMDELILGGDISNLNPKVVKGYIEAPLQRKYTNTEFFGWAICVFSAGYLNLLALPDRW